jgi:hypothetical protein
MITQIPATNHERLVDLPSVKEQEPTLVSTTKLLQQPLSITEAALEYVKSGLSVIPIGKEKRPTVKWTPFQQNRASVSELTKWWSNGNLSIAAICGRVSGNLELIDFDEKYNIDPTALFAQWRELVDAECPGLVDRLVMQKSMNKGYHSLYSCSSVQGNQKLAQRPATEEELLEDPDTKSYTLIETRGEGGYFLCYPSQGYSVFNGSLLTIPEITSAERDVLHSCARALDRYIDPNKIVGPKQAKSGGNRPGDIYNQNAEHRPLLEKHGWTYVKDQGPNEYWRRPGKQDGVSAEYNKEMNLFKVWSSNASPLEREKAYTKFSLFTQLEAKGDYSEAARMLAQQGYGQLSAGGKEAPIDLVEEYLNTKYSFRRNLVTTYVEFCRKDEKSYQKLEDIQLNSLHRELQKARLVMGIDALSRLLYSDYVETYDPFISYFDSLEKWDESKTDYIAQLADSVKLAPECDKEEFVDNLKKWLVGMAACATKPSAINQTAIILVGEQGIGKGTWLNMLVPNELTNYKHIGTIDPNNKDTLVYLSECILINLDELETLKRSEIGELKTIMTLPSIKVRRPYDRLPQDMIRRASFVGSINQTEFLNDPTGSRRFLTFKVDSINFDALPDINMVMSQAYTLFKNGERWWFDQTEINRINERNKDYAICGHEEELLLEFFPSLPEGQKSKTWLNASAIAERIKMRRPMFRVDKASVRDLGTALVKHRYASKRVKGNKLYAVE